MPKSLNFSVFFALRTLMVQCKNIAFFAFLKTDNVAERFAIYL